MTLRTKLLAVAVGVALLPVVAAAQDFGTINFDFDSDVLDATAQAQIEQIAADIIASGSYKPSVVVGYTDAVGGNGYNFELGLRRANRVSQALVAAGVPVDRIGTVESRGKTELLVSVAVPERLNRRVTVSLADILAACSSYRSVALSQASIGESLQDDLVARLNTAVSVLDRYKTSGGNAPAYQMAGATQQDCSVAVGLDQGSVRKLEYAKKCLCNAARLDVALGN